MKHKWERTYSHDWANTSGDYNAAHSSYKCEICGVTFTHWYHTTPSIYEAIKDAGVEEECYGKENRE